MKKILTILLTVLMLIGVFVMPVSVEADSYEWKTAFNNEINRAKQTYPDAYYWIIDFDNNGIPELIYDTRTGIGGVRLLHYNGQSYASYFLGVGELRQNKNKFYSLNTHMGVGTYTVFEFTNGKTNKVFYGYYSSDTGRIKNPNEYRYYIKVSNKTTQVSRSDFYNKLWLIPRTSG